MRYFLKALLIATFVLVSSNETALAQCAACKANMESANSDPRNTKNVGRGINNGILYLLAVPYLAGGIIAFAWYRQRKRTQAV